MGEEKKYVIPGDLVATGDYKVWNNVVRVGDQFFSTKVGVLEESEDRIKVIALNGPYIPKVDDIVIGKIIEVMPVAWTLDINSYSNAFLPAQHAYKKTFDPERDELSNNFKVGDLIIANIAKVERGRDSMLSLDGPGLGKLEGGEIIKISPVKIPRFIGKNGSMIQKIQNITSAKIFAGQNGIIVAKGNQEAIIKVKKATNIIERMAYISGLTDKMESLLNGSV